MSSIEELQIRALADIEASETLQQLDDLRVRYLGKKGEVTAQLKSLGAMEPGQRKAFGQAVNAARDALAQAITGRRQALETSALEEKLLLARHFSERLQQLDGFVTGPPPDLSVVMFRYQPTRGSANEFNQQLIKAIQHDGRIFLSSTKINGEVFLRLAVLGFRTHLQTIELTLDILQQKAREERSHP